jgi:hypothetical protein
MKFKHILPTEAELMRFRILDGNDNEVLGRGDLPADNAAFLGLEELLQTGWDKLKIKRIEQLGLCESVHGRFRMCGTVGVYKILRVL